MTPKYDDLKLQFMQELPNYLSSTGLLVQKDGDSGDSCQRMGTIHSLLYLLDDPELDLFCVSLLAPPTLVKADWGYFRRSDDPNFWGFDPRCTSRDQLATIKMALGRKDLALAFLRQTMRMGFHQNYYDVLENRYHIPDPMIPSELSVYARGLLGPFSWLITWFTDLGFMVDELFRDASELNVWSQDNMLALGLLHACHIYPSPTAKLTMKSYKTTNFMYRIEQYHGKGNGCLPLLYLFKMAFLKLEDYK